MSRRSDDAFDFFEHLDIDELLSTEGQSSPEGNLACLFPAESMQEILDDGAEEASPGYGSIPRGLVDERANGITFMELYHFLRDEWEHEIDVAEPDVRR